MAEHILGEVLVATPQPEPPLTVELEPPQATHLLASLTPEQIRALDAIYAEEQESSTLSGLIGLWGSSMLLGDLVQAHLGEQVEEQKTRNDLPRT